MVVARCLAAAHAWPVDVGAGPELHAGGDDQDERHQPVHGVDVERQVHDAHQRQAGGQGDLPAALEVGDLGVAAGVELVDRVTGQGAGDGVGSGPVAGVGLVPVPGLVRGAAV